MPGVTFSMEGNNRIKVTGIEIIGKTVQKDEATANQDRPNRADTE